MVALCLEIKKVASDFRVLAFTFFFLDLLEFGEFQTKSCE
jgi:hypothetical protein